MRIEAAINEFNIGEILQIATARSNIRALRTAADAIRRIPSALREPAGIKILNQLQPVIRDQINALFIKNRLSARVMKTDFLLAERRTQAMLVKVELDNMIYDEMVMAVLPQAVDMAKKAEGMQPLNTILTIMDDNLESVVKNMLASIDEEKKREIIEYLLAYYKDLIIEKANDALNNTGVSAKLTNYNVDLS